MIYRPDQPKKRMGRRWPVAFTLLVVGLMATAGLTAASSLQSREGAPLNQSLAANLPAATCNYDFATNTRSCELWAKTGSVNLPGGVNVPVWGYVDNPGGAAQLPGPTLIVNQGEIVKITLHNTLSQATSLSFPSQSLAPDMAGAAAGADKVYTFTAGTPGTQLYEAGLTVNGPRQVAMGMFGGLIVRPNGAANRLYPSSDPFNVEALLIFSELDPALNTSGDPLTFNMRNYSPKYWLINGQAYPMTAKIGVTAGDTVALRYINAGVYDHSIGSLGLTETIMGSSGNALTYPHKIVAETLPAGQTLDLQTTVPAGAIRGFKYALYSGDRHLDNAGKSTNKMLDVGGMLTFLEVTSGATTGDVAGPQTSGLTVTPAISSGNTDLTLTATVSDAGTGNHNVAGASYVIDNVGGADTPISGSYGSPTVNLTFTIPAASLASLTTGEHSIYVRGSDDVGTGNLGPYAVVKFSIDKAGPQTTGSLSRTTFNGTQDLVFTGTADETGAGNSAVTAAEYSIDNGSATALAGTFGTPTVALNLTVPQATIAALTSGSHTLKVRSQDALGQWGEVLSVTFTVDTQGPATSNLTINPTPNNGTLVFDVNNPGVKVTATLTDGLSNIVGGELFIESLQAPGTGLPLQPVDSGFNSLTENAYTLVPLAAQIQNLTEGSHTIYVRAQDAAGNWGTPATAVLVIDKTGPAITTPAPVFSANPTLGARVVTMTVTATDPLILAKNPNTGDPDPAHNGPASNVVAGEWFIGADPGKGNGTAMAATDNNFNNPAEGLRAAINTCNLSGADNVIAVRAKDAAGNWGPVVTQTLTLSAPSPTIFENSFEQNNFSAWCSATGSGGFGQNSMTVNTAASMNGTPARGMQISRTAGNNTLRFVTDNTPANEGVYSARFYFNPGSVVLGNTTIVDILQVMDTGGTTPIVRVQWRRNAGNNQVRAAVRNSSNNNTESTTAWVTISASAPHYLEINWDAATRNNNTFKFYVDGVARTLPASNNIDRRNFKVDAVSMGILNVQGANFGGTVYFDAFKSTKGGYIGQ